ncbi:hypothetical protein OAM67_01710 [bacterium]|nr:hypothetical protein [bacterium]
MPDLRQNRTRPQQKRQKRQKRRASKRERHNARNSRRNSRNVRNSRRKSRNDRKSRNTRRKNVVKKQTKIKGGIKTASAQQPNVGVKFQKYTYGRGRSKLRCGAEKYHRAANLQTGKCEEMPLIRKHFKEQYHIDIPAHIKNAVQFNSWRVWKNAEIDKLILDDLRKMLMTQNRIKQKLKKNAQRLRKGEADAVLKESNKFAAAVEAYIEQTGACSQRTRDECFRQSTAQGTTCHKQRDSSECFRQVKQVKTRCEKQLLVCMDRPRLRQHLRKQFKIAMTAGKNIDAIVQRTQTLSRRTLNVAYRAIKGTTATVIKTAQAILTRTGKLLAKVGVTGQFGFVLIFMVELTLGWTTGGLSGVVTYLLRAFATALCKYHVQNKIGEGVYSLFRTLFDSAALASSRRIVRKMIGDAKKRKTMSVLGKKALEILEGQDIAVVAKIVTDMVVFNATVIAEFLCEFVGAFGVGPQGLAIVQRGVFPESMKAWAKVVNETAYYGSVGGALIYRDGRAMDPTLEGDNLIARPLGESGELLARNMAESVPNAVALSAAAGAGLYVLNDTEARRVVGKAGKKVGKFVSEHQMATGAVAAAGAVYATKDTVANTSRSLWENRSTVGGALLVGLVLLISVAPIISDYFHGKKMTAEAKAMIQELQSFDTTTDFHNIMKTLANIHMVDADFE